MIGHNGAGKSTLMRTLFGLVKPRAGHVLVDGAALPQHTPRALAACGVAMMPEGRGIFPSLTVAEVWGLALGSAGVTKAERPARIEWVLTCCRRCAASSTSAPGLLSGGQQQMVSIGRALLGQPRCLILDEPSIGLAPKLFQDLMQPIRALQRERASEHPAGRAKRARGAQGGRPRGGDEGRAHRARGVARRAEGQRGADGVVLSDRSAALQQRVTSAATHNQPSPVRAHTSV